MYVIYTFINIFTIYIFIYNIVILGDARIRN